MINYNRYANSTPKYKKVKNFLNKHKIVHLTTKPIILS
jgi:hypothetical protein